jgi:hypothetical protein
MLNINENQGRALKSAVFWFYLCQWKLNLKITLLFNIGYQYFRHLYENTKTQIAVFGVVTYQCIIVVVLLVKHFKSMHLNLGRS